MEHLIHYENSAASNYLVLKWDKDENLINYQSQMLLNNKIEGVLDFNINFMGEGWNCFYDVTSMCSLESFLSRKKFSRNEFLVTLRIIINNIFNLHNYLLYDTNILLNEKYIFVDPETLRIGFVYLPFRNCTNDIKAFFLNLAVGLVKFENEESDNYIQRILQTLKSELFSMGSLKQLIETLLGEEVKGSIQPSKKVVSRVEKAETMDGNFEKQSKLKASVKIPGASQNKEPKAAEDCRNILDKTPIAFDFIKRFRIFPLALQPIILFLFVMILNSGVFKMSDNPKFTFLLLLIIFIALDILLIRMVKEKRQSEKENYKPLELIKEKMKRPSRTVDPIGEEPPSLKEESRVCHGQTVILRQKKPEGMPYLKEKEGDEIIRIDKESILIGRMDSFVDYVIGSSTIGKIHAEIIKEMEDCYVMDCNSRNGTYINGMRAVPNTRIKINHNDEVRFANKEYVLVC